MNRAPKDALRIDLEGLAELDVAGMLNRSPPANANGTPLDLPVDEVVEDPNQPRREGNPGFCDESLAELAQSINETDGVKTPISVRPRNAQGLYVINHGARRLRASRLGGRKTIRAFIDDHYDAYDQAIENIQRESFTPMEIARFIGEREREGDSRTTIARRLGKSKAYVTQHAALQALPAVVQRIYDAGITRDAHLLYELGNLHKQIPDEVEELAARKQVTRQDLEVLKARVKGGSAERAGNSAGQRRATGAEALLIVRHDGRKCSLRLDRRASALTRCWVEDLESGQSAEIEVTRLTLDSIVWRHRAPL